VKDVGKIDPSRPVHIAFGNPMTVSGNGRKEHEAIIAFINDRLKKWFNL
jgi:1-acyl-sn-glycerol-3-phosphate acyltransferase